MFSCICNLLYDDDVDDWRDNNTTPLVPLESLTAAPPLLSRTSSDFSSFGEESQYSGTGPDMSHHGDGDYGYNDDPPHDGDDDIEIVHVEARPTATATTSKPVSASTTTAASPRTPSLVQQGKMMGHSSSSVPAVGSGSGHRSSSMPHGNKQQVMFLPIPLYDANLNKISSFLYLRFLLHRRA